MRIINLNLGVLLIVALLSWPMSARAGRTPPTSFEANGLYGFKDSHGVIVIPAQYQHVEEFNSCGIVAVWKKAAGWMFIDTKGVPLKGITPYIFDNGADYFQEGLARF